MLVLYECKLCVFIEMGLRGENLFCKHYSKTQTQIGFYFLYLLPPLSLTLCSPNVTWLKTSIKVKLSL